MQRHQWPLLVESLRRAPILRVGNYDYFVHPLTDGVPSISEALLREVIAALISRLPPRFDRYLTPEAMGIPVTAGLTLTTRHPFTVARKRAYGLPGEIRVAYQTGYSQGYLHVNNLREGDRVVIVDDVASTGGTLRALVSACRSAGAKVEKILILVNKGLDLAATSKELDCPVEALASIRIQNGTVEVLD